MSLKNKQFIESCIFALSKNKYLFNYQKKGGGNHGFNVSTRKINNMKYVIINMKGKKRQSLLLTGKKAKNSYLTKVTKFGQLYIC